MTRSSFSQKKSTAEDRPFYVMLTFVGWVGVYFVAGAAEDAQARPGRRAHGGDGLDAGRVRRRLHRPRH